METIETVQAEKSLKQVQNEHIFLVLRDCKWNRTKTSEILSVCSRTVGNWINGHRGGMEELIKRMGNVEHIDDSYSKKTLDQVSDEHILLVLQRFLWRRRKSAAVLKISIRGLRDWVNDQVKNKSEISKLIKYRLGGSSVIFNSKPPRDGSGTDGIEEDHDTGMSCTCFPSNEERIEYLDYMSNTTFMGRNCLTKTKRTPG